MIIISTNFILLLAIGKYSKRESRSNLQLTPNTKNFNLNINNKTI